jgi:predicted MFS family arabinose efflux permease
MSTKSHPYAATVMVFASWTAIMLPRMVVTALLPMFESTYRLSHVQAGLLMTSYFYAYTIMQVPSGALSDRFGRKMFIIISLIGSSAGSLAIWKAQSFEQIVFLRVMAGFFAGLWYAPSISFLTTSVRDQDRGKAMGIALAGSSISDVVIFMMIGTLGVGGFEWRDYFFFYAIPGFLCALVAWFLIKETSEKRDDGYKFTRQRREVLKGIKDRVVSSILVFSVVVSLASYSLRTFVPTFFVQSRGLSSSEAALLMLSYAITVVVSGPLGGILFDRLGCNVPSEISLVALCATALALPVIPLGAPTVVVLIIWGLLGALAVNAFAVLLTQLVSNQTRGTFLGMLNMCTFLGAATGPLISGYSADIGGFSAFFISVLGMLVLASLIAIPVLRAYRKGKS